MRTTPCRSLPGQPSITMDLNTAALISAPLYRRFGEHAAGQAIRTMAGAAETAVDCFSVRNRGGRAESRWRTQHRFREMALRVAACRSLRLVDQQARIVRCVVIAGLPEAGNHRDILLAIHFKGDRPGHGSGLGICAPQLLTRGGAIGGKFIAGVAGKYQSASRRGGCRRCGHCPAARARLPSASPGPRPAGNPRSPVAS